jgi:predicted Zn-dependent protease
VTIVLFACAACTASETAPSRAFDACAPLEVAAPAAEFATVDRAIAAWQALGITAPTRASAADRVAIVFTAAPAGAYGYYDGDAATIYVDADLGDDPRGITLAHELGHALGLVHVAASERASVMNPGNLTVAPTAEDRDAVVALWGACAATSTR